MKSTVKPDLDKLLRRTPHGVRGLKLSESFGVDMGAGRTPHGVRGLKLLRLCRFCLSRLVAPLTGCVD